MTNDPEMHRKLLEKMFQTCHGEEGAPINVTAGGAFTKKGDQSGQKEDPSKKAESGSSNQKAFPERDSIGLYYVNPESQQPLIELNQSQPLTSIYAVQDQKKETEDESVSEISSEERPNIEETPMLGQK